MHYIEFSSLELLRENFKMPWKSQGKLGNLVSEKCGHPDSRHRVHTRAHLEIVRIVREFLKILKTL